MRSLSILASGPHTRILSPLCAACPHSAAGCCVGPPPLDWSDIGRVVALGGRDWLLEELAARRVVPDARGLAIARVKGLASAGGPRVMKCAYHGPSGCTIAHDRRPATCNYYVCDAVLDAPGVEADAARRAKDELAATFERWDQALAAEIASSFPEGPVFDAALLDWLGRRFEELASSR